MFRRTKVALLAAALGAMSVLAGCQAASKPPANNTPAAPTASSTEAAQQPRGDVEVALKAITWPNGQAVARVNDVDIKTEAWRQEVTRQLRLATEQYQVDWNDQANLVHLPTILDQVLDHMVDLELVRQLAAKEQIVISDTDLQKESETTRQQILDAGQFKDLESFLQSQGLNQQDFEALLRDKLIVDRLLVSHGGPAEVEQVHARQILVADEQKAKEVLDKLAAGERFEDLAKTYSLDNGSKEQGGDMGWLPRGTPLVPPQFDESAFALQPGQTSAPVKGDSGYYVFRVEERGVRKLEEPMLSEIQQQNFLQWLDGQRKAAKIERLFTASPTPTPTRES